jgi:hypothetical protein
MAANRENQSIWIDFKYNRWKLFFMKIFILTSPKFIQNRFIRPRSFNKHLIIKDSFITPYYRIAGCKLFGHRWSSKEEDKKYEFDRKYCWNCSKYGTMGDIRDEKINKILK